MFVLLVWSWWCIINVVKLLVWLVSALLFGVWWCQGQLLYMPTYHAPKPEKRGNKWNERGYQLPSDPPHGMPFEDVRIRTEDGVVIHAWLITQPNRSLCPTIIMFHGNAGNIGYRIPLARGLYHHTGANLLLVDYRGYGDSDEAALSEPGLRRDAQASLMWVRSRPDLDSKKIFLFGSSLGGAVSIALAHQSQDLICGLIVENTFTCIRDMVPELVRGRIRIPPRGLLLLRAFLYFFLTNRWESEKMVGSLRTPILFISGLADELIPPAQMRRLYDLAVKSKSKQLYTVSDGDHNRTSLFGGDAYFERVQEFMSAQLR